MIPIRDDAPRWTFPGVTLALIAINVAVFVYQGVLYASSPGAAEAFIQSFGATPALTTRALTGSGSLETGLAPLFTSMFLHGGIMHILGNMWFLWIFGDNVEDELGHVRYLLFYLACGLMASLAHYVANPFSTIPSVGASGAISGVMGAYLVRFPWARVTTLIPFIIFFTTVEIPAALMLVYWFAVQFLSGASTAAAESGVAWWAHIGGFAAGALLVWLKPPRRRRRRHVAYRR